MRIKVLTWLQAAVKVQDDHQEAAQAQGKNQPHHFCFSHAENCGGEAGEPKPLRLETNCSSFYLITDKSMEPRRWPLSLRVRLCILGYAGCGEEARTETGPDCTARAVPPAATENGCGRRLKKFRGGLLRLVHFLTLFSPHKSATQHSRRLPLAAVKVKIHFCTPGFFVHHMRLHHPSHHHSWFLRWMW